ncbi:MULTISPECIES: hypothetical protein [unclassified Streptomyces]|uniref:hypothetical protein n=1 Tax=unclassified Streptomyces TaxID=2593676 RepID=UPI0033BBE32A
MFRKKAAETLDTAAAAVVYAGQKVGGEKGERAANAAASALLGRHYCPPNEKCRICS